MTITNYPLLSFKVAGSSYLFNIYLYHFDLVGIEEDPSYRLLFEMDEFGTPTNYFDWRKTQTGFGSLLDIKGKAIRKDHLHFSEYRGFIKTAEQDFSIKAKEWGYRIRK